MLEEKHRGHEMMHLEMILIFFGSIFLAQFLLVFWKIKHKKSYQVGKIDHLSSGQNYPSCGILSLCLFAVNYFIWLVDNASYHLYKCILCAHVVCVECVLSSDWILCLQVYTP